MHRTDAAMRRLRAAAGVLTLAIGALAPGAFARADETPPPNDYPTVARADYVLGCMAANNNTHQSLLQCSCAIDTIAGLMPYSDYEKAETALSMQATGGGERTAIFRDPPEIKAVLEHLREAQAEANLQCFR
jgi:hypothetical protein